MIKNFLIAIMFFSIQLTYAFTLVAPDVSGNYECRVKKAATPLERCMVNLAKNGDVYKVKVSCGKNSQETGLGLLHLFKDNNRVQMSVAVKNAEHIAVADYRFSHDRKKLKISWVVEGDNNIGRGLCIRQ
jgi:hypothetical protein